MIRPRANPLFETGGTAILYGNLAPDGAVIKTVRRGSAGCLQHTGPAVVFKDYSDMDARINRDDLDVTADSVLVLQNAGPLGGPGMPEWGMLPLPKKLLQAGRARHGAHLRRAHERHGLRNLRSARFAGKLDRRPAGVGRGRRLDFARHPQSEDSICMFPKRNWPAGGHNG